MFSILNTKQTNDGIFLNKTGKKVHLTKIVLNVRVRLQTFHRLPVKLFCKHLILYWPYWLSRITSNLKVFFIWLWYTRVFFNLVLVHYALESISTVLYWYVIPNMIVKRWLVSKFLNIVIKRCDWFLKFLNTVAERCGSLHVV